MTPTAIVLDVPGTVGSVVDRLRGELRARAVTVFAVVDHAAGARQVGLTLPDEVLMVFGSPAVGTTLMQADPRAGLDLPLRLLVWSDPDGTHVAYEDPARLAERYDVSGNEAVLVRLRGLLEQLAATAARSVEMEASD